MKREDVLRLLPNKLQNVLGQAEWNPKQIQELRLRIGKPFIIRSGKEEYFLSEAGFLTHHEKSVYQISKEDLQIAMEQISQYSLYAYEDELRQGFLTISGGHRVGVTGRVMMKNGMIRGVYPISCVNIRFAHEIKGCGEEILPYLITEGFCHTLVISPPGGGKTTLLRDLIRLLSNGTREFQGVTVGVVDERSEVGGSESGIAQLDLGIRTDVLDGCPKKEGMMMLLRSMTPTVIAVDEIGGKEDLEGMEQVRYAGCKLLATIHGNSLKGLEKKPYICRWLQEKLFERYVILEQGTWSVYDEKGNCLFQKDGAYG